MSQNHHGSPVADEPAPIANDRDPCRRMLDGLFTAQDLNLYANQDDQDNLPVRIGDPDFWEAQTDERGALDYSPAARHYLLSRLGRRDAMSVDEYFHIWSGCFFAARKDVRSARDILMLFLHQNLEILKELYLLALPPHRHIAPTEEALHAVLDADSSRRFFHGAAFSRWVLDAWLPASLRRYHRERIASPSRRQAAPIAAGCIA